MSEAPLGEAGAEEPPDPEQIDDPEEFVQSHRLRELYELRERIRDYRTQAREMVAVGQGDQRKIRSAFRSVFSSYLFELEPLMTQVFAEEGEDYWEQADLGEMAVQPPAAAVETGNNGYYGTPIEEPAEPWQQEIEGLETLASLPSPIEVRFEWKRDTSFGDGRQTQTVYVEVPWHILDRGYRLTNQFLADIGFEIEREDSEDPLKV